MEDINELLTAYRTLHFEDVINYEKFNHYAITHHSTQIEGSTLTEIETRLLLDEQLTPQGKPLLHSLMVKDHHDALIFTLKEAASKREISTAFIREMNCLVLKNTGSVYRTIFGDIDSSKGEYRKSNVSAGSRFFVHFEKVEKLVEQFCTALGGRLSKVKTEMEQLHLTFDAHFDSVTIHPFYDGNGRTARLLPELYSGIFRSSLGYRIQRRKSKLF